MKKCIKAPPDPKKAMPKGKIREKVCEGTQKLCKTPSDCTLRNCNKQKCNRPTMELKCLSHEDCKLAPKCKVNAKGKKLPSKPNLRYVMAMKQKNAQMIINALLTGAKEKYVAM